MDCDAFYASVEKRDDPSLEGKPVIIGGGRRGVVSTACYVARIRGVRSAMPMFQALKLCPDAVIIKPRMEVYAAVSRQIRAMMEDMTPAIEPLSLDEAFMDLRGTARLHGAPPAVMLARLVRRMRNELGVTGSIGLSHNKFLAKIASDLDKPRGFSVIGEAETAQFLQDKPVRLIWGVGQATQAALEAAGIRTFSDLLRWERPAVASGTRAGSSPRRRTSAGQIHLERDDFQRRYWRSGNPRWPYLAPRRKSIRQGQGTAIGRARGHAETEACQSHEPDAPAVIARRQPDG
jgi:DNA polymerase-4